MTKQLLNSQGISAKVIELNQVDNGDEIQKALHVISGQRTVPNVFVKGKHLGGNDDTQAAARSGKLQQMLG
jgi:glutaredoxin 3